MLKSTVFALAAAVVLGMTSLGHAIPTVTQLELDIQLDAAGVFTNQDGQLHDVYRVTINNADPLADVTSLTLSFGPFTMDNGVNQTFATNDTFPVFGFAPDSFFVIPPGTTQLAVDVIDDGNTLAASYTLQGTDVLITADTDATVALLSVPAGAQDPISAMGWIPGQQVGLAVLFDAGAATANPTEIPVTLVPEPASLALLGLGGLALIRRR